MSNEQLEQDFTAFPNVISTNSCMDVGIKYYDLLSKLHILLVKNNLKSAYYDSVKLINPKDTNFPNVKPTDKIFLSVIDPEILKEYKILKRLKKTASKIGLKTFESDISPVNFTHTDIVPVSILNTLSNQLIVGANLWIYSDNSILNKIKQVISGTLRVGTVLDYPQCCVEWMAATKTKFLEKCYLHSFQKLVNPSELTLLEFLRTHMETNQIPDYYPMIHVIKKDHAIETYRKYPFVFHHACKNCLDDRYSSTANLNTKYGDFAKKISSSLYDEIILESKKLVNNIRVNLNEISDNA